MKSNDNPAAEKDQATQDLPTPTDDTPTPESTEHPKEIGGRKGPDPTRYGDWEKAGRCIDF